MDHEPLRVASAFPDPPFEVPGEPPSGLDIELVRAIADELGRPYEQHRYEGADFEGIYSGLAAGRYDLVASGATITPHRRTLARFCAPYLQSGQSLVVDVELSPGIHSTADLHGSIIGVQDGNTSQPVAERLHAEGAVAGVKVYAYDEILKALDDVGNGTIAAFMKLEPVMRWLTRDRPSLSVVQTGITTELIALAVRSDDEPLAAAVERAQQSLAARGELRRLGERWLGDSDPAATRMVT
ncbi:MAG TPA: ABC transporter substrate-binding protein [Acidimicrobiia bacterium]|nr:ABC transporter substrate-binding protein [Acidimicrobiia bacterium]